MIIGLDLLKRASFGIDYESKTFSVGRVRSFESVAQMEKDSPFFTADVIEEPSRERTRNSSISSESALQPAGHARSIHLEEPGQSALAVKLPG